MNNLSTRLKIAIESPLLQDVKKGSGSLYPSSASIELSTPEKGKKVKGACLRQQYYRSTGEPISNQVPGDVKVSALIGDQITEMVKDLLDQHGFQSGLQRVAAEHSFYIPEINLSGRCDFVGYDHVGKEYIGIEVKSVGEWKASKCIEAPAEEHVMQSLIYLDHYQKEYPQFNIKKWYILYISRTENYAIKAKKHGSPLAMVWDTYITIHPKDKCAVVHSSNGTQSWKDFTIENINNRYKKLLAHLETKTIPDRDYEIQYSPETITDLYKRKELTRKMDIEKVEKWLAKGAPEGKLKIEMGDGECSFCSYKATCWPGIVAKDIQNTTTLLSAIPVDQVTKPNEEPPPWV